MKSTGRRRWRSAVGLPVLLLPALAGCFHTTIRSGLPPGLEAERHQARWRSNLFLGTGPLDLSPPLSSLCPEGWAEIRSYTDVIQGLVALISVGLYAPHTTTVVCATPGSPKVAPLVIEPPSFGSAAVYPPVVVSAFPPPPPEPRLPPGR